MLQFLSQDRSLRHDKDFFKQDKGRWILRKDRFKLLFGEKGLLISSSGCMFVRPASERCVVSDCELQITYFIYTYRLWATRRYDAVYIDGVEIGNNGEQYIFPDDRPVIFVFFSHSHANRNPLLINYSQY